MADLRSEQVLAAVAAAVTGLATTGTSVTRARVHEHEASELPALAIYAGDDVPDITDNFGYIDWQLTVLIEAAVSITAEAAGAGTTLETDLAQIRKEFTIALLADRTLGLSFVHDVIPGPAQKPTLTGEGGLPVGFQITQFQVIYRTSYLDPSA